MTAAEVKVALAGEGADEMLGGYWWYNADRRMRYVPRPWLSRAGGGWCRRGRRAPNARSVSLARRRAWSGAVSRGRGTARIRGPPSSLFPALAAAIDADPPSPPEAMEGLSSKHPVEWLQYWDLTTRMHDYIVETLDRHTMAWSLEVRVPFLDHEVAEWCLAMPPDLKQARREKRVLRRRAAERPAGQDPRSP